jgi:alpha-amylase/alpha-mannosidase (GH57 family)
MEKYICIHGHFYQPPRENPWLESIELQDSAYPYHDWNERIAAECYAPNAFSRILDGEKHITQIVSNYSKISFNFGPTLLSWMDRSEPEVYQTIIDADQESQKRFSGHGSALAQAYNHVIMPLANRRDKRTQVLWALRDFTHRFKRDPEGMWLPETAVDIETLEVLAEFGIRFTVLAPRQARRIRLRGRQDWQSVEEGKIDPTVAYECPLPSGKTIALFFYDDPVSRAVAFEGLLSSGEKLASRLAGAFTQDRDRPQLVHIATDGETYGHHHRHGDMALAYALDHIESNGLARLTNYGEYLEKHPPTHEVEIIEKTSWSCVHGIERWRADCGCNSGGHPRWNQAWRAPLRDALDMLRDALAPQFEALAGQLLKDPWLARDDYIGVVLDRSRESVGSFLESHAAHTLTDAEQEKALKLLELQRHAMLMYTSCGWFFDELSRIETVQVIRYAGRCVQLAQELFENGIEERFLDRLEKAKSNIRRQGDGRQVYDKSVKPAMVDLLWVAAHYAISSLFEDYGEQLHIHIYSVTVEDYQTSEVGKAKLATGRARIASEVTLESALLDFGVLYLGDHTVNAGVKACDREDLDEAAAAEIAQAFSVADFPEVIRLMDKRFGHSTYSLSSLFRDEQRAVLERVLESTLADVESSYRRIYDTHHPLMLFLTNLGNPLPRAFYGAAEFILNTDLRRELMSDEIDVERIGGLLENAAVWDVELDTVGLSYALQEKLENAMERVAAGESDLELLRETIEATRLATSEPFEVDLWRTQNLYWLVLQTKYADLKSSEQRGGKAAKAWTEAFAGLGELLSVRAE